MRNWLWSLLCLAAIGDAAIIPDFFQSILRLHAGPTSPEQSEFVAATNPASFSSNLDISNLGLEAQATLAGNSEERNIFQLHGQLSHYFPNPDGFGVDEHPLPPGSNVSYLYMLARHGSRYPTIGSGAPTLAAQLKKSAGSWKANGKLAFLNSWTYKLGVEALVPIGKQELFDSGILHWYKYGHLYPKNGGKIVARSTTQGRMKESAEYFLSGFFGLDWTKNATLELIIDALGFNNTLAGYYQCPNAHSRVAMVGSKASAEWISVYLANATDRIQSQIKGYNWTVADTHNAQSLCAYETVALGYSSFCDLFTYEEWLGYEYSVDIAFAGNDAFQSPVGRAIGIGWVHELLARLHHHTINVPTAQVNVTLDNNTATFPTNQALNFDFSHDTNIMSILVAIGLTQFAAPLPQTHIIPHDLVVSHVAPFAARLDIEVIDAPQPVSANRSSGIYEKGGKTQYIHFILNQRTVPLGKSFPECGARDDGWCELKTFVEEQKKSLKLADYEFACFGNYPPVEYGKIHNGAPLRK